MKKMENDFEFMPPSVGLHASHPRFLLAQDAQVPPPGKLDECATFMRIEHSHCGMGNPCLKPGKEFIALREQSVLHQECPNCTRLRFSACFIDCSMIELAWCGQEALQ